MADPYVHPGTKVLRNKEDIRDVRELEAFERMATASRMETLPSTVPIAAEGYCEIHRYIFQDIYDWAGEHRTVEIAKSNDLFCLAAYIARELAKRLEAIRAEDGLRGLGAEAFAARAAELNAIHPFREGNGRTLRAFLMVLGGHAGHEIDMERIDPQAWNEASREGFRTADCTPMRAVIAGAIVERRSDRRGPEG